MPKLVAMLVHGQNHSNQQGEFTLRPRSTLGLRYFEHNLTEAIGYALLLSPRLMLKCLQSKCQTQRSQNLETYHAPAYVYVHTMSSQSVWRDRIENMMHIVHVVCCRFLQYDCLELLGFVFAFEMVNNIYG